MSSKAYEVEWIDISSSSRWVDKAVAGDLAPLTCHTVGYIAKRNKRVLVMYSSKAGENDSVSDRTSIPMSCVKKIKRLR